MNNFPNDDVTLRLNYAIMLVCKYLQHISCRTCLFDIVMIKNVYDAFTRCYGEIIEKHTKLWTIS